MTPPNLWSRGPASLEVRRTASTQRRQHEATSQNGAATLGYEAIDAVTIGGLTTFTVSATTSLNGNSPRPLRVGVHTVQARV